MNTNEIHTTTTAASNSAATYISSAIALIIGLIFIVLCLICYIKMFTSAGKKGWKSIIPILNTYTMSQIAFGNKYGWIGLLPLLTCIPVIGGIIGTIANLYVSYNFARSYGKSVTQSVLYLFFAPIMAIIWLAKRDYDYEGPRENIFSKNNEE
ncbi:MAG: DUF5684 domain-containing protein [Firmicutes bacterium]|nr:DUF5684 domain-containing protein [Bacillota bacterium]